jgi:hypothetical protein
VHGFPPARCHQFRCDDNPLPLPMLGCHTSPAGTQAKPRAAPLLRAGWASSAPF